MDPMRELILRHGHRLGFSYQQIGDQLGLTRERVRQLLAQLGLINTQCVFPGCTKNGITSGYCQSHNIQKAKGKKLTPLGSTRGRPSDDRKLKPCSFPGCDRFQYVSGLCQAHYLQSRRGNELKPLRLPKNCKFAGCGKKHYSNGYCAGHNNQLTRGQPLRTLKPRKPSEPCKFPGCTKPKCRRCYASHYNEQKRLKREGGKS